MNPLHGLQGNQQTGMGQTRDPNQRRMAVFSRPTPPQTGVQNNMGVHQHQHTQHTPQLQTVTHNPPLLTQSQTYETDEEPSMSLSQDDNQPPTIFRLTSDSIVDTQPRIMRFSSESISEQKEPLETISPNRQRQNSDLHVDYDLDPNAHINDEPQFKQGKTELRPITAEWPQHQLKAFTEVFNTTPLEAFKVLNKELGIDPKFFDKVTFTPINGRFEFNVEGAGDIKDIRVKFDPQTKIMHLELAKLDENSQGSNVMKKAFKGLLAIVDKSSIPWQMEMKANLTVGGYAWPKYGFLPTEKMFPNLAENVSERMDDLQQLVDDLVKGSWKVTGQPDKQALLQIHEQLGQIKDEMIQERDKHPPDTKSIRRLAGMTTNLDFIFKAKPEEIGNKNMPTWFAKVSNTSKNHPVTLGKAGLLGQDYTASFDPKKDLSLMNNYVVQKKVNSVKIGIMKSLHW